MKAAWFEKFGAAKDVLTIGSLDTPTPGPLEVLVRLHASAVNPSDVKKRAGAFPQLLDDGLVVPHSDGAGVVEAVGDGIDESRVGERVFVYQAQHQRRFGTAAEYVALPANRAARLPDEASFDIGACVGIPIMTAHRCVFADGPVRGQTVVVTGGAGRVGQYAIQWAVHDGATVIATASNAADEARCRALGASAVVNHRDDDWGSQVTEVARGPVDRLVDVEFGANLTETMKFIRTGGTIATYSSTVVKEPTLPFLQMMYRDLTLRMVIVYDMPEPAKEAAIRDTTSLLAAGSLTHHVAETLPLADIARAHELVEQGTRGCIIVAMN